MSAQLISILLPTYNECDNIIRLIESIDQALPDTPHEIIVIDDDSPDKTWQLVAEKSRETPHVRLIHRIEERGLTSAYNRGIREAKGDILVWLDCDFSHPPEKIPEMLSHLSETTDAVIASRYQPGGSDSRGSLWSLPVFLSWLLRWLTGWVLKIHVKDTSSGFIAIDRKTLNALGELRGDYGEYFIDLVYRLIHQGYQVKEIPYHCTLREFGESKTATNIWGFIQRGIKYLQTIFLLRFSHHHKGS